MAFALLDGTSGTVDIGITISGSNSSSGKAIFGYVSCDITRDMQEQTTFASGRWRARIPTMMQLVGRAEGFSSVGNPMSDPLAMMTTQLPLPAVITLFTGCTYTFNMFVGRDHEGMRAAGNSERGLDFESSGSVTTAWVVA